MIMISLLFGCIMHDFYYHSVLVPRYITGMAFFLLFWTRKKGIDMALRRESCSIIRKRVSCHLFLFLFLVKTKQKGLGMCFRWCNLKAIFVFSQWSFDIFFCLLRLHIHCNHEISYFSLMNIFPLTMILVFLLFKYAMIFMLAF